MSSKAFLSVHAVCTKYVIIFSLDNALLCTPPLIFRNGIHQENEHIRRGLMKS